MLQRFELLAAGFAPTTYVGQRGVFLAKTVRVDRMPHANTHRLNDDYMYGDMMATTEVTPDGRVQFFIPAEDYLAGPFDFESTEAQALLKDAVAAGLPADVPSTSHP